jgi:hypothetical protein
MGRRVRARGLRWVLLEERSCEFCHFSECGSRSVGRSTDDHELTCAYGMEELMNLLGLYRLWFGFSVSRR